MKRKVALLLALVMVVSLIPMNLFGAPAPVGPTRLGVGGWLTNQISPDAVPDQEAGWLHDNHARTAVAPITLTIPLGQLAGRLAPRGDGYYSVPLEIQLSNALIFNGDARGLAAGWWQGGAMGGRFFAAQQAGPPYGYRWNPDVDFNQGGAFWQGVNTNWFLPTTVTSPGAVGVTAPGVVRAEMTALSTDWFSWGRGFVSIVADRQLLPSDHVSVTFEIPVRGFTGGDAWLTSTIALVTAADQIPIIPPQPLAGTGLNTVAWSVTGGARGFTSALLVPPLRLTENRFGVIRSNTEPYDLVIRLEAPEFYTWSLYAPGVPIGPRYGTTDPGLGLLAGRPAVVHPLRIGTGGTRSGGLSFTSHPAIPIRRIETMRTAPSSVLGAAHGRHILYIHLDTITRNNAWNPDTGHIQVENLWLIPDPNASAVGDVSVDVQLGRFATVGTAPVQSQLVVSGNNVLHAPVNSEMANLYGSRYFAVWNVSAGDGRVIRAFQMLTPPDLPAALGGNPWFGDDGNPRPEPAPHTRTPVLVADTTVTGLTGWGRVPQPHMMAAGQTATLHVGTRGAPGLVVEVYDGPNNVRTGHLGTWRPYNALAADRFPGTSWVWNRDNEGLAHWSGVRTSTLIIEETIAGGFRFGFGAPIDFQFLDESGNPHPGIRILGVEARAGNSRNYQWTRGALNNFFRGTRNIPGGDQSQWPGANQNWMTFSGWVSALGQRLPNAPGVGRLDDTIATLYMPSQTITDVPTPGILEVRFWLSLEAGFEWKYGADVNVTISGDGVSSLPGGTYTATIATAQDPIVVSDMAPVQLETGTLYNVVGPGGRQALDDITIEVVNNAAFGIGEELWIYIATETVGRNFDLNIATIPTITVNTAVSGLRLDHGRLVNPHIANLTGRDAIAFTVTRQPYGGGAPAPVITISNLFVEGTAMPGVEYQLVVSGTGVANNDQEVYARLQATNPAFHSFTASGGVGALFSLMNRGVFTSLPYNVVTLQNVGGGLGELLVEPPYEPEEHRVATFTTSTMVGGVQAIVFEVVTNAAGQSARVTMMSSRVFADFLGGTVVWDGGARTVTVTGDHWAFGDSVTVVMTVGSSNATINGSTVDIATFAGQPQFAGEIEPIIVSDRQYVPARFLANAFGIPITSTGHAENMVITLGTR